MANLVAYLRVSSAIQAEGYGLEIQRNAIERRCEIDGHLIGHILQDVAVSGSLESAQRPALTDALNLIRSGAVDGLIVARLDRLARGLTIQEGLLAVVWNNGGCVFTADDGEVLQDDPSDPMRTAMRQIVGVFAQLERAMIVKRMSDGRRRRIEVKGQWISGRGSFGEVARGVPDTREQRVIARAAELRRDGLTWRAIAQEFNADPELRPRTASSWTENSASRMLAPSRAARTRPVPDWASPVVQCMSTDQVAHRLRISRPSVSHLPPSFVVRVPGRWASYDAASVERIVAEYDLDTVYGADWIGQGRAEQLSGCSQRRLGVLVAEGLVEVRQAFNGYRRYRLADVTSLPTAARVRVRRLGQLNVSHSAQRRRLPTSSGLTDHDRL
ncbi:recombinase family protein [Jatrophihabitans telluris]|uniref:Recombinase family protein n=1 Tax=Jatrophihabitans telluris TaxID=2038343 RepID=A0ABY4R1K9_9ACTN|nr:recombinase family protein [Jatrophihabitans telluris]UQX89187.1 recombinase family protein [Jatrophihabitans telluris]